MNSPKTLVSVQVWTRALSQFCLCLLERVLAVGQGLEGR